MLPLVFSILVVKTVTAAKEKKTFLVGFVQVMDVSRELEKDPSVTFIYTDSQGKTAKQIRDIEKLVAWGINLLITSPRDQHAFGPALKKVAQKGIPTLLLTRRIQADYFTTFTHPDDRLIAHRAAIFIVEKLQGKGSRMDHLSIPLAVRREPAMP